ncbi:MULTISPECIES: LysR family transcriptional regulator [unclassified Rathayibacter]|uniref:LysR family transcriptional regulator n=1 Tax=unclassified Rathayibacter TaxID=2609250 RepID=UPI00188A198C|nr:MULTISPECIES: LysR family transcriptional regulator [unclassified Rathayibacter]MBF4463551.1 LysR family transcriptional regulator [Rathayibacter sp. VKM Ac-2879]MBF4504999.1 LysR family transcriptional regulator [Rathayibacter sp. VKM Ac-2878]
MDDRQLAAFVAVAEELSFTRAATRLFVVQSTLSATIRALEQELGSPLFARSTRRVALTTVGEALLPSARSAIDSLDRMRSLAAEDAAGLRGRVRVGTFSALDLVDLPGALGLFRTRHPLVDLLLRTSTTGSTGLAEDLRRGLLDVALLALPATHLRELAVTRLVRSDFVLLVESGHPLAAHAAPTPHDLDGLTFVDTPAGFGNRLSVDLAFRAAGARRRVATEVADLPGIPRFVQSGLGPAIVPRAGVEALEGVTAIGLDWPGLEWELSVCTAPRPSAAVQALTALLVERSG